MNHSAISEPTLHDVLNAINDFATHVEQRFTGIDQRFEKVEGELFLVHSEIAEVKSGLADVKQDLADFKDEALTAIDGLSVMHQTFDVELLALRSRFGRMEKFMSKVAKHLHMEKEFVG